MHLALHSMRSDSTMCSEARNTMVFEMQSMSKVTPARESMPELSSKEDSARMNYSISDRRPMAPDYPLTHTLG